MILRLKSRLVSGLIVSTIGMTAAVAIAADNAPTGASSAGSQATTTGTPSTSSATPSSSQPSATPTSGADTTMAPRGADPAQTTNTATPAANTADSPAKKIFDQLDLNHDGMLSLDEFSRATFQQPAAK